MKLYAFIALVLAGKIGSLAGWAMDVDRPQAVSSYSHVLPQRDAELAFNPFQSLSNSDLRNLRLSCRTFNELVLQHYQICQPVSGKKQHIPLNKARKFNSLTKIIRNEFTHDDIEAESDDAEQPIDTMHPADAYFQLGEMYWQGLRNSPKYYKALDCYVQAYRRDSEEAIKKLAATYDRGLEQNGTIIVSKDFYKAVQLLLIFSRSGRYPDQELLPYFVIRGVQEVQEENIRKRRRLNDSLGVAAANTLSSLTFPSLPVEIILTVIDFLSNSDLLNLRLVCQKLDALLLSEYEICQTVTGRKECVPHKKAAYFKKCTKKLQGEFGEEIKISAEAEGERLHAHVARNYFMLGDLYWEGIRTVPEYAQALYYYGEAYRRHGLPACLRLGLVYDEGVIVTKDKERASQLYSNYCGGFFGHHTCNNAAEAYYYLGRRFATGYQAIEEKKKKIDLLSKSASQGHLQALFELGKAYYRAEGGRKDFPRAIECIKKAGGLGHPKAYCWLARTFKEEKDTHQAIEFYKKAMPSMGFDEAGRVEETGVAYDLCKLYLKPQNFATYVADAVDLLKQITNQNLSWSWAEYRLGKLYLKGRGVKKDTAQGIALLKKAADNPLSVFAHNKVARMFLGIAYYKGKHIAKDDQQASQLLKFNFNSSPSFFKAFLYRAKMMYEGRWYDEEKACSIQDTRQAVALLERLATVENYTKAQLLLAQIYQSGY